MIRLATHDDIPALIECGRRFHAEAGVSVPFDADTLRETLAGMIGRHTDSLALVAEHDGKVCGCMAVVKFAHYFAAASSALELYWYMAPERRGSGDAVRMLRLAEDWARTVGCATLVMVALSMAGSPAANLYGRTGYRPMETHFVKEL